MLYLWYRPLHDGDLKQIPQPMNLMLHEARCSFGFAAAVSLALHASLVGLLFRAAIRENRECLQPVVLGVIAFDVAEEPLPLTLLPAPAPPPVPELIKPVVEQAAQPLRQGSVNSHEHSSRPASSALIPAGHVSGSSRGDEAAPRSPALVPSFFQVPLQGRSVVYVLDRSISMGPAGYLKAVKEELLANLAALPPDVHFQVVFYNSHAELLPLSDSRCLVPATAENKDRVRQLVEHLPPEGGTQHLPALQLALSLRPDLICFLTDADDLDMKDVQKITQINRGRSAINTFELTTVNRDKPQMPLHVLARQNRGIYRALKVR